MALIVNFPKVVGRFYTVLAVVSVLGTVASFISFMAGGGISLDITFILWLWLGHKIREASPTARWIAIGISLLGVTGVLGRLLGDSGTASLLGVQFQPPELGFYVIVYGLLGVFAFPLVLLTPAAREQFRRVKPVAPSGA